MKRIAIYLIVMAAVLVMPLERTDVADLQPVQTVALYKTPVGDQIETDTGDVGAGKTVDLAYADLLETASGVIYLDTARYLLVSEAAVPAVADIGKFLKKGVAVCAVVGRTDLKEVSKFLSVRSGLLPIHKWKEGVNLPVLDCRTDRIKFLQKNVK